MRAAELRPGKDDALSGLVREARRRGSITVDRWWNGARQFYLRIHKYRTVSRLSQNLGS